MSKKRILFLDIDGVLIPSRAYFIAKQTNPFKIFDPCVVGMINHLCHRFKMKLVIHSSWLRTAAFTEIPGSVKDHMIEQGLKTGHFHSDDSCTYKFSGTRWNAIDDWLSKHVGQVNQWWVLDDEKPSTTEYEHLINTYPNGRVITTDFDEGLTMKEFNAISKDCCQK